jgi:DNA-binding transcriptional regulator YhcF (GntR family)
MRNLSNLWIDRAARPTLQDQLARQIRERIRSGDLAPGDSLPSTRDLATELTALRVRASELEARLAALESESASVASESEREPARRE